MSSASWIGRCGTTSERCEEDEEEEEVDVEDESEQGEVVGVAYRKITEFYFLADKS